MIKQLLGLYLPCNKIIWLSIIVVFLLDSLNASNRVRKYGMSYCLIDILILPTVLINLMSMIVYFLSGFMTQWFLFSFRCWNMASFQVYAWWHWPDYQCSAKLYNFKSIYQLHGYINIIYMYSIRGIFERRYERHYPKISQLLTGNQWSDVITFW